MAVFDDHFLPSVLLAVEVVQPLDDDALLPLAILAQHVLDVQLAADLAVVADLSIGVVGQNGRLPTCKLSMEKDSQPFATSPLSH